MKTAEILRQEFSSTFRGRMLWEEHWRDCYAFAMPQRGAEFGGAGPGGRRSERLFDGTAADAVEQLAASLLSELTPPWARWVELSPGPDLVVDEAALISPVLDRASATLQSHFDRSNFEFEIHQCYLDLVTAGTACLMFEEAPIGEASAFRFTAVPIHDVILQEGATGRLDRIWHRLQLSPEQFTERFGQPPVVSLGSEAPKKIGVLEAVRPIQQGYHYIAIREHAEGEDDILAEGEFASNPVIGFRWLKAPGESHGRSPVMTVLSDIKTANKVVELILKNATIAVTGIWQADDDSVLNPGTVKLVPGSIIPKAVGSAGLAPCKRLAVSMCRSWC